VENCSRLKRRDFITRDVFYFVEEDLGENKIPPYCTLKILF
jgi:hypothetical protein